MIDLIFIITLSINAIFISLTVILGYTGDGISSLYAPIVMLFSLISIAFITIYELFNKNKKAKGSKMLYFFPLLFVFFYIIDSITTPYSIRRHHYRSSYRLFLMLHRVFILQHSVTDIPK